MNCVGANELGIEIFITEETNLLFSNKQLVQTVHCKGLAVKNPVITEITEGDGFRSRCFSGHVIGDIHRLAHDRIICMVPQIVAVGILEGTELERSFVIHDPHRIATIFFVQ